MAEPKGIPYWDWLSDEKIGVGSQGTREKGHRVWSAVLRSPETLSLPVLLSRVLGHLATELEAGAGV
ncbi:MAG: hypothetical protein ABIO65_07580, partial [Nitrospiria bacterium]